MSNFFDNSLKCNVLGSQINYYRDGAGDTILFVHGITTYSFIWRKIAPYFVDNYDVIVVDLLGCGDSDIPLKEDLSLKKQAMVLHEFVKTLNVKKLHLVSHDVGGGIAQIFAVNFEELLYSLTLINSVAYNFWPVQPIAAMKTPIIRQIAMASLDVGMFALVIKRGLYHKSHLTDELMELFWKPMKSKMGRKGFLRFAKCLDNKNLTEIEEKIKKLKLPTLIVRGDADVYLSKSIALKLNAEIPGSKLKIIETGGHFIQEDEPEVLSNVIMEFLKGIK